MRFFWHPSLISLSVKVIILLVMFFMLVLSISRLVCVSFSSCSHDIFNLELKLMNMTKLVDMANLVNQVTKMGCLGL